MNPNPYGAYAPPQDTDSDPIVILEEGKREFYHQLIHRCCKDIQTVDKIEEALDSSIYLHEFEMWLALNSNVCPALTETIDGYSKTHVEEV